MTRRKIKSTLKEITIALVLLFIVSQLISYIRAPDLGSSQLPQIEATLVDGSTFIVKKGEPLLIHFWAISCPVCKLEAPNIETVSKEHEVLTIAVNSGSNENIQAYMQEHGLHFKVLNDTEGFWSKAFKIEVFPTTFIYDAKGKLRFTEVGYTTTAGLLARLEWAE
ncbi:protein disulfide oxidoreductase [Sulfurovum sp. TSL1]|uniref:protein disulfide oxidoreductase n=1 Tax=Sulfurovum sp. TSL1 TaxID=2826994 RepID=UPI001CC3A0B8|nr:protein disulfide oxidoreductase [Sulfurovum sp. TSL1]GIT97232.1 protein disulfide oxidoreductase [Sulfurovum sp. TSL1]